MHFEDLYISSLALFSGEKPSLALQILMEECFHLDRSKFWLKKKDKIHNITGLKRFYRYRKRLLNNEPLAYILKKAEFYGEIFSLNKNVLIPRPETEILVEKVLEAIESGQDILDIGAGSGNISIILAKKADVHVHAAEKSTKALYLLKKNIQQHRLNHKITCHHCNIFPKTHQKYNIIVSNPPYIPLNEWKELHPGIRNYEPDIALVGGDTGREVIEMIASRANRYLHPGGKIFMEIGYNQKSAVERLLREEGFKKISFTKDYSRIPRVVTAGI